MAKKTPDVDATAEKEYKKVLELRPATPRSLTRSGLDPARAQGRAHSGRRAGFWRLRGEVEITGPQALTAQGKTAAETYLKKAYAGYHGDEAGLEDLKKLATTATMMPADFKIESVTDIAKKQEGDAAAFAAANPDIALLCNIRTRR